MGRNWWEEVEGNGGIRRWRDTEPKSRSPYKNMGYHNNFNYYFRTRCSATAILRDEVDTWQRITQKNRLSFL
jgi:hypothetical protein